jgi:hypothetical protein
MFFFGWMKHFTHEKECDSAFKGNVGRIHLLTAVFRDVLMQYVFGYSCQQAQAFYLLVRLSVLLFAE